MPPVQDATEQQQYLTFYLGGEEYALGVLRVKEILEYNTLTTVPQTPPWIRGVINLRGHVVPVVDLAVQFGLPPTPITKRTCIIIAEVALAGQPTVMGVLVDAVSQVMDLAPGDIAPPPAFGTAVRVDCLQGLGKVGTKFVLILDMDQVLAAPALLAVGAAASGPDAAAPPAEPGGSA